VAGWKTWATFKNSKKKKKNLSREILCPVFDGHFSENPEKELWIQCLMRAMKSQNGCVGAGEVKCV
jgi:hypothetical protein